MIRRDGPNQTWLLISQVAHAHVSGHVADVWGNRDLISLPHADQLVPAIRDHDAGWSQWERAPTLDPATGFPRNFTEMPMTVATEIWTRSIDACARHSPLGGIWVSRHFTYLGEKARGSREDDTSDAAALDRFLQTQEQRQADWRSEVERAAIQDVEQTVEIGFRWVQFFDAFSLWLCCAERTECERVTTPDGTSLSLIPLTGDEIAIEPWPLHTEQLVLSVPARRLPARPLASDAELHAALRAAPEITLEWTLLTSR